ncbi:MAG: hypothetical protein ABI680_05005, partial [Chthoniobacteraceae bacterium]
MKSPLKTTLLFADDWLHSETGIGRMDDFASLRSDAGSDLATSPWIEHSAPDPFVRMSLPTLAKLHLPVQFHPHSPAAGFHGQAVHATTAASISSLDFAPAGAPPADGPASSITQTQVDALSAGFDQTLTAIENNLVTQVFGENLPLLGTHLLDAAAGGTPALHYVTGLKTALHSGLSTLTGSATYSEVQVESAINGALGAAGISGAGANLDLSDAANVKLGLATLKNFSAITVPVEASLGLPNLGLHTSGNAQTALNYHLDFGAGLDGNGFYVDTAPGNTTFSVTSDTRLPGFNQEADLTLLPFNAQDNGTDFNGQFNVTLKDPNHDGALRLSELAGSPDLLDATLTGSSDLELALRSTLPVAAALPTIGSHLEINWRFNDAVVDPADDNSTFGEVPSVSFRNNSVNLGSFFNGFAGQVLDEISTVTGPLKPVIDILTAPIPILSDLGSNKVTLLDFAGLTPSQVSAIQGLSDIVNLVSDIASFQSHMENDTLALNLGSVGVVGDLRVDLPEDLNLTVVDTHPALGAQSADLNAFLTDVNNLGGGGLSFPLLTNDLSLGKLFLGQNADLFDYHPTPFGFDYEYTQYFPVLGFIGVNLGGHFGVSGQFDFGFDTQGLRDYAAGGATDPADVFNGFFVRSTDDAGNPVTGFSFSIGLIAGIEANIGIANAGVDGDLTATVSFNLSSSLAGDEGKVRGDTLISTPLGDLFDPSGELTTGLRAYLEVGISPFSVEFSFDSPRVTLLNFDGDQDNHAILASDIGGGDLALNVGPRAAERQIGNLTDSSEAYYIDLQQFPGDDPFLDVHAFKFEEGHNLPNRIVGDGGEHGDAVEVAADLNIPVVFSGGANRDILTGGAAADILNGDDG